MMIENYHGTLYYSSSFFFEGKPVVITQKGAATVNITLVGNAFWGDNTSAVTFKVAAGAAGRVSTVGNLLADYGTSVEPNGQTARYTDVTVSETNGTIAAALDDFRRLGALDLQLNHPGVSGPDLM